MKKRFKLLTTIASLCLAVALMAFGVYAAKSSTFNVNSTVTFEASDIQVEWAWYVEGGKLDAAITGTVATVDPTDNGTDHVATNTVPTSVAFDAKNNNTITYIFSCTNKAGAPITVTPSFASTGESKFAKKAEGTPNVQVAYKTGTVAATSNVFATLTAGDWAEVTNIANNNTVTFAVQLTLVDATMDLDLAVSTLVGKFTASKYKA